MIKLLIKKFIADRSNTSDPVVRERYCILGGILGIICNVFLFAVKLSVGMISGSIAIISDSFNNLSDTGSSFVSIIGAKLSSKKPDKEHPFGHGRIEYISSLVVSFIIMLVGFELFRTSLTKIFSPDKTVFRPITMFILILSVLIKLWMFSYNRHLGRCINSSVLSATARDSLNDVISTSVIIITSIIGSFINFPALDGIMGTIVSIMIMASGFQIAKDTVDLLLGASPDPELIKNITACLSGFDSIVGTHDLIVHDYGPGRILASVHAEVPDNYDIVKVHEDIDFLEHKIENELGIHMVIHMDPISVNCERTSSLKKIVIGVVKEINADMNIHDFRMTDGENNINLIFDVEVPLSYPDTEHLKELISQKLKKINPKFNTVIDIDISYV